jgi:hypothetical protein
MRNLNTLTFKKLNEVEFEKKSLIAKMFELHAEIDSLKSEILCLLIKLIH